MRLSKILSAGIFLLAASAALAQAPSYSNVGRTPTKEEIQAWDISVGPDGKGLPAGQGTAKEGAPIFAANAPCATARTEKAERSGRAWLGASPTPKHSPRSNPSELSEVIGRTRLRCLTSFTARCREARAERSRPNEVYALTAFILFKSNIIQEGDVPGREDIAQGANAQSQRICSRAFCGHPGRTQARLQAGHLPLKTR